MRFVGIRTVFVLRLSFAVSKPKEILSLSTGDQFLITSYIFLSMNQFRNISKGKKSRHQFMLLFSRFLLVLIDFKQNFGPYPPGSSGIDTAMGKTCPGKLCVTNKMRHPILTSGASCLCDNVFSLGGYSKVGHRILKFLSHDIYRN